MADIVKVDKIPATIMVHTPPKGVTAVDVRRAIARETELLAQLPMVERSVFIAATGKVAQEYETAELSADFGKLMPRIARDVGIRTTSGKDWENNMVRIVQIMRKYYPMFSMRDVQMAFELSVTGGLNDYLPKDRNGNPDKEHYQMFNADFFCKIMNAYKAYRIAVIQKAMAMVPPPEQEQNAADAMYYRNLTKRRIIEGYEYFKANGRMPELSEAMEMVIYDELEKAGLAAPFRATPQEQQYILQRILFDLSRRQLIGDKKRVEEQGIKAPECEHPLRIMARRRALKQVFATMVQHNINITDYIKIESDGK